MKITTQHDNQDDKIMTKNSNTSSPSAGATSTSVDRSCNVDSILNEMNRSIALTYTKTSLFKFYNSACKKGSECSINWTSATMNPFSNADVKNGSNSSWMSSLDFWKTTTKNDNSSACPTEKAISTMSSSSYDLYERIGSLSNQLVTENRIVTGITQRLEAKLNEFMSSLKFTTAGIFLGAMAGAAVATGVIVGMMAVTGAIGTAESGSYSSFVQLLRRRLGMAPSETNNNNNNNNRDTQNDDPRIETDSSSSSAILSTNGPLILLQGYPSSLGSVEEQCKSCFQNITAALTQQKLGWKDIRRISAYLVAGRCEANTFRKLLLEEFSIQSRGDPAAVSHKDFSMPLISLLFVTQLENEKAMLQLEFMASK